MAKEIATKTKLDTRIAADIAAAMPVATKPVAAKAALASEVAKKAIVIDTEEVQAAAEQVVDSSSADVIVAQAAGASSSAAAGGAAAGGMSTTALVVAGVAVAAAAGSSSSSSTPAAATPAPAPTPTVTPGVARTLSSSATPDIIADLTANNDTITAATGTLASTDVITDASINDSDEMSISVNGYVAAAVTPTILNVEKFTVTGNFAATGLDLTNINGGKQLDLNTSISAGTATVDGASAVRMAAINAGSNITTLAVNTLAGGTSGSIAINAGSATTATITGNAGADTVVVTAAPGSTVNLVGAGGADAMTLNVSGATTMTTDAGLIETLTLNTGGSAANTITVTGTNALVGTAATDRLIVGGAQNLAITGDGDILAGATRTTSPVLTKAAGYTGTVTLNSNAALTNFFFNEAVGLNVLNLTAATGAGALVVADGVTTIRLTAANTSTTYGVDTNTATAITAGSGTLAIDLAGNSLANATQTLIATDASVGTLSLTNNTRASTITTLNTSAGTTVDTVVLSGTQDLTIGTWTATAGEVLTAGALTGNLTATVGAAGATIIGGAGNDFLTGGGAADALRGGAGNDVFVGGAGAFADTFTGGEGNDTFRITVSTATDVITDFSGSDVVGLSVGMAAISALKDGNAAAVAAGGIARTTTVSGAKALAAGENILLVSGTYATAAALDATLEAGGTNQLTFASATTAGDDFIVVWSNGTNTFIGIADLTAGAATIPVAGDITITTVAQLSGITDVTKLNSTHFQFIA